MEELVLDKLPGLKEPCLIIGLGGYPDAGRVSTYSVAYLKRKLKAERFAKIRQERFYDYSIARPTTLIENGTVTRLRFPSNVLYYCKAEGEGRDAVLLKGFEPTFNWRRYVDMVVSLAVKLKVVRICTLGGLIDRVEEPKLSAVVSRRELRDEVVRLGIALINYEGPCSIFTVLLHSCGKAGIDAISLWGHVPYKHYLALARLRLPHVKTAYQMLKGLSELTGVKVDLEEAVEEGRRMDEALKLWGAPLKPGREKVPGFKDAPKYIF